MSFGFGFSDILNAANALCEIYERLANASRQFEGVSDSIIKLQVALEVIHRSLPQFSFEEEVALEMIQKSLHISLSKLEDIQIKYAELGKSGGSFKTMWKKLVKKSLWNNETLRSLQENITNDITMLNLLHSGYTTRRGFQKDLESQKREILQWISRVEYQETQEEQLKKRYQGTCQWFLQSSEFQTWLSVNRATMFCSGEAGVGKTILTSVIIRHLLDNEFIKSNVGIAYLYCNFKQKHEQEYVDLLASLLRQLLEICPSIPSTMKQLYEQHREKKSKLSDSERLLQELGTVLAEFSRTFIIVDGLDECHDHVGRSLVKALFHLQTKHTRHGLSIFATAKPYPEIQSFFKGHTTLEYRASEGDIWNYLGNKITLLPIKLPQDLQEKTKLQTVKAANGFFLLARYFLDHLKSSDTPRAFENRLLDLPKAYAEAYKVTMTRIEAQGSKKCAMKVFNLVTFAIRPLSLIELQHAYAINQDQLVLDSEDVPTVDYIVYACAGMVTVEERSTIIRLAHSTAKDFLQQELKKGASNGEEYLARICMIYLSIDESNQGHCNTDDEYQKKLKDNPFFAYAACNWGYHVQAAGIEQDDMVLTLLQNENIIQACSQTIFVEGGYNWEGYSQRVPRKVTGLHMAALFGLSLAVQRLIDLKVPLTSEDSNGQSPLLWAAEYGHEGVVNLLLKATGFECSVDKFGRSSLLMAAMKGHQAVVTSLLDSWNGKVNLKDYNGRTALSWAAGNGHLAIVQLLLDEKETDIDSLDYDGVSPISWAARYGHYDVVKLLSTKHANIDSRDDHDRTPFSWAAEHGHWNVLKLLLEVGKIDVTSDDKDGRTPILWAAMNGHSETVEFLLDLNREAVNYEDVDGRTALSWAAMKGHNKVVQILLDINEVDPMIHDDLGQDPLILAAKNGHLAVVKALMNMKKADVQRKDINSRSAFLWASMNGHADIVNKLLNTRAIETDLKDVTGRTAFSWAAGNGHEGVVRLLLPTAEIDSLDHQNRDALSWSAQHGHDRIVKLLINTTRKRADAVDKNGRTPLSWAAEYGHETVVRMLLETGEVQADSRDRHGRTPLLYAILDGHQAVAKVLLETGKVKASAINYDGQTSRLYTSAFRMMHLLPLHKNGHFRQRH